MPTSASSTPPQNELTLYVGASCPFCHKVIHFLNDYDIDIKIVDIWQDQKAAQEMTQLAGTRQVPCLKVGSTFMLESDDIIQQLKTWYL